MYEIEIPRTKTLMVTVTLRALRVTLMIGDRRAHFFVSILILPPRGQWTESYYLLEFLVYRQGRHMAFFVIDRSSPIPPDIDGKKDGSIDWRQRHPGTLNFDKCCTQTGCNACHLITLVISQIPLLLF